MPAVPPSLRSLALADVTPADVRWMIKEGESLVELKAEIPSDGIGPTIASFANSLGGWLILGVDDKTRKGVGWKPPGRADDLDYLRERLRREVDPLPPFAARPMRYGRRRVSVVRVYESADTPHIVRGTGQVFVRHPGARHPLPLDAHDHLIELARRGEDAGQRARKRLEDALRATSLLFEDEPDAGGLPSVFLIARAAPLTVTPTVRDWPLKRAAADWCAERAEELAPRSYPFFQRGGPWREPFGRGIAARVIQQKGGSATDSALVAADSAGVIGARIRWGTEGGDDPSVTLDQLDTEFGTLARALVGGLSAAEAFGRSVAEVRLNLPDKGRIYGAQLRGPRQLHASRELTVPADDEEIAALAASWHREFQRALGVESYEDEPQ
jgi:hypothetical protein